MRKNAWRTLSCSHAHADARFLDQFWSAEPSPAKKLRNLLRIILDFHRSGQFEDDRRWFEPGDPTQPGSRSRKH